MTERALAVETGLGVERATPEQLTQLSALFASLVDVRQRGAPAGEEALRRIEISWIAFDVLAGATGNDYLIGPTAGSPGTCHAAGRWCTRTN